jgi:hypothetical protein
MDLAIDDEAIDHLRAELPDKKIYAISGASHKGVADLMETLWHIVREEEASVPLEARSESGID